MPTTPDDNDTQQIVTMRLALPARTAALLKMAAVARGTTVSALVEHWTRAEAHAAGLDGVVVVAGKVR